MKPQMKLEIARIYMAEARERLREALDLFGQATRAAEMDADAPRPADFALFEQFEEGFNEVLREHGYEMRPIPVGHGG